MAAPAHSQVVTASNVTWSDAQLFQGYVLFLLALPLFDAEAYTKAFLKGDGYQQQRLPLRLKWPITNGVLNTSLRIWQNASITPPNSKYIAYFYDETRNQVAVGSGLITIAVDPYTLTVPTLTVPSATASTPTPEDQVIPSTQAITSIAPIVETASGTGSSVTITNSPVFTLGVFFNGQKLISGTDYNIVGTTITFLSLVVASADKVEVVYWA